MDETEVLAARAAAVRAAVDRVRAIAGRMGATRAALALMRDDIHAIGAGGAVPTRCLHLYGRALETLAGRTSHDPVTGAATPCDGAARGLPPVPRHAREIARDGASRFG